MFPKIIYVFGALLAVADNAAFAGSPAALRTGVAEHAFDHLGDINNQADVAAASGDNIIYTSGAGVWGYQGLPDAPKFARERETFRTYLKKPGGAALNWPSVTFARLRS